jgi:hypothetical protein
MDMRNKVRSIQWKKETLARTGINHIVDDPFQIVPSEMVSAIVYPRILCKRDLLQDPGSRKPLVVQESCECRPTTIFRGWHAKVGEIRNRGSGIAATLADILGVNLVKSVKHAERWFSSMVLLTEP